mgnify:CR=1 FL=1
MENYKQDIYGTILISAEQNASTDEDCDDFYMQDSFADLSDDDKENISPTGNCQRFRPTIERKKRCK